MFSKINKGKYNYPQNFWRLELCIDLTIFCVKKGNSQVFILSLNTFFVSIFYSQYHARRSTTLTAGKQGGYIQTRGSSSQWSSCRTSCWRPPNQDVFPANMKTFINYAYIANLISENKNALQDEFRAERDSYREAENSRKLLNDTDMLEIKRRIKKLPLDGSIIPIHKYTTKGGGGGKNWTLRRSRLGSMTRMMLLHGIKLKELSELLMQKAES